MIKRIKIIRPGYLVRAKNGIILDARSSVILIQTQKYNIIVDSSRRRDRDLIIKNLNKHGLNPTDIDILINTHGHKDHIGNNDLFTTSRIYTHHLFNAKTKCTIRIKKFPFNISDDIKIIETPGHSYDSLSILLKKKNIYAITGDSIPLKNNILNWIPPVVNVNPNEAMKSMKKIINLANIIIPGHDFPFKIKNSMLNKIIHC
ncbi:MAG: MBL fold metallo-hydrolase [Candidatus Helarchaeota archaeon]